MDIRLGHRRKKIFILGSTGSVGINTLEVIRQFSAEFEVAALSARANVEILVHQALEFDAKAMVITDETAVRNADTSALASTRIGVGEEGLAQAAEDLDYDLMMVASSGVTSLKPVLIAIERGKAIAIANKEILVMAGAHIMEAARRRGVPVIPVDSEHNAIFQCLQGSRRDEVRRVILTGSGGPLRELPREHFAALTPDEVTRHPKWNMGKKISVDSATLMNKGLEIIEAQWLFELSPEEITVLIHPEAVVHSMVEFKDGSVLAQLGPTDMKLPILYALSYPRRLNVPAMRLGLESMRQMHFMEPDFDKFPCLSLALKAAELKDSTLPAVLSAADEMAVARFLEGQIGFNDIPLLIGEVMRRHRVVQKAGVETLLEADRWAREESGRLNALFNAELSRVNP